MALSLSLSLSLVIMNNDTIDTVSFGSESIANVGATIWNLTPKAKKLQKY